VNLRPLEALLTDPPHRRLLRVARVARTTGFPLQFLEHPLGALSVARQHGLNAAMLHALHASNHPHRLALADRERVLDYAKADAEINAFAHALRGEFRLRRGEALAIALENRAEYVLAWFAAMRAGVRVVHAGSHVTADELVHMARVGGVRCVLASATTAAVVRTACERLSDAQVRVVLCGDTRVAETASTTAANTTAANTDAAGTNAANTNAASTNAASTNAANTNAARTTSWSELIARGPTSFPARGADRAESVVFTSGTTGRPRGAARDFGAFGPTELARVLERLPFQCAERHLVVAPLSHSAPQVFALLQTALGGTLYLEPRFDAAATLRALAKEHIHSVFMVPTMVRRVLELPATEPLPDLRAIVVGSSEFSAELRRAAIARFGAETLFDFYGATELGWVTLIRGDEMLTHPGSVGRPLPGQQVRILDEHVEDTGYLDEDGYLHLTGRARDMVKSGGVNVYPAEVERVLETDPQLREVVVIGVPDREWGERVVAVVVPRDDTFDPEQARTHARAHLSPAKVPREWKVVDALPRNTNGKVLRTELRARFG
jgi:acyl-CoA synthetase (AMP-forming)/AMP-acid ligase II